MYFEEAFSALINDPSGMVRSGLRVVHFFGLALGLGTATVMDLLIIRFFLGQRITAEMCDIFRFCAKIVTLGLFLLWITGLGFILYYYFFAPVGLTNEKVLAKAVIATILSINGWFIHRFILPLILAQQGKLLFENVSQKHCRVIVASAVISGVSWYSPLVIAGIPQLSFTVPFLQLLAIYAILLTTALVLSQIVLSFRKTLPTPPHCTGHAPHARAARR